jgi:hypothetical protein
MKKVFYKTAVVLAAAVIALASTGCNKSPKAQETVRPAQTQAVPAPAAEPASPLTQTQVEPVAPAPAQPAAPASSATNWDSLLDQYEKFVDDYIATMQKAMAGDFSAMTTAATLLEQAESLSGRIAAASNEISAAQSARLLRIQTKLANAAASAL